MRFETKQFESKRINAFQNAAIARKHNSACNHHLATSCTLDLYSRILSLELLLSWTVTEFGFWSHFVPAPSSIWWIDACWILMLMSPSLQHRIRGLCLESSRMIAVCCILWCLQNAFGCCLWLLRVREFSCEDLSAENHHVEAFLVWRWIFSNKVVDCYQ